jgi:hypothetical protein
MGGFVGKPKGNRPLGRNRRRWHNMKFDLKEIGQEEVARINLAQDRHRQRAVVKKVMNLYIPKNEGNFSSR